MATETPILERIYTIPLRRACMKVPHYKRARKGIVTIKEFIAHHMKVPHRDVAQVKLDVYLNNELWFRGPDHAPARVTVKATKKGDVVHVTFAEAPARIAFMKARQARIHKKGEKKVAKSEEKKETPPSEEKKEEKTVEEKKAEEEKEKSAAISKEHLLEQQATAAKHTTKAKTPEIKRMALKK